MLENTKLLKKGVTLNSSGTDVGPDISLDEKSNQTRVLIKAVKRPISISGKYGTDEMFYSKQQATPSS